MDDILLGEDVGEDELEMIVEQGQDQVDEAANTEETEEKTKQTEKETEATEEKTKQTEKENPMIVEEEDVETAKEPMEVESEKEKSKEAEDILEFEVPNKPGFLLISPEAPRASKRLRGLFSLLHKDGEVDKSSPGFIIKVPENLQGDSLIVQVKKKDLPAAFDDSLVVNQHQVKEVEVDQRKLVEARFVDKKPTSKEKLGVCLACKADDNFTDDKLRTLSAEEQIYASTKYQDNEGPTKMCASHYMKEIARTSKVKKKCCNPYSKNNHNIRNVKYRDPEFLAKASRITEVKYNSYLCEGCVEELQNDIYAMEVDQQPSSEDLFLPSSGASSQNPISQASNFSSQSDPELLQYKREQNLNKVSLVNETLDLPPVDLKKMKQEPYKRGLSEAIKEKVDDLLEVQPVEEIKTVVPEEVIENMKNRIEAAGNNKEKVVEILSVLPHDWSLKDFQDNFGVSWRVVDKVKSYQLTGEHQIRKLRSDAVQEDVKQLIEDFYFQPGISRQLSGRNYNKMPYIF